MKRWIATVFLIVVPLGAAQAMNVAVFLQKADSLEKKGMMALFSSDYKLLKGEVQAGSEALRAERLATKAAGRPTAYCPPNDHGSLTSDELLIALRTIPEPKRPHVEVKDALRALLARKYPCR
ncbi:MAG TPA: hypothetical protein VGD66_06260 [Allosphingosinicella sp.]|jgi:hypothetical protein